MGTIVHRNNALKDKMVASNVLMGFGNDSTDTVEKRIRDLEEGGGGGGGSVVVVTPLLDEGVHIADISVNGRVSELYAPEGGGGGSGNVDDVTINGQSIVDDHVADIPIMSGATQQSNGSVGLVPAPSINDRNKVLMGDGTWGSGGLVDDVLVDGTSVVNNKVANIDLTGKQDVLTEGDNVKIENDVISVPEMVGATSMESGTSGVVPQPLTSDKDKFLRGDGTWSEAGGGNVDDVVMNGQSIVDANKVASFNNYVELTRAEWEALPNSKYTDNILYCIKDSGSSKSDFFSPIIYSLAEREVGVWTDGKPLYQKTWIGTFTSSSFSRAYNNILDLTSLSIDTFVNAEGVWIDGNKRKVLNFADDYSISLAYDTDNKNLQVLTKNFTSEARTLLITFRYTKTTDNPGTGKWTTSGVPVHHYSTEEQVIGTWIDGRTIYERTYVLDTPLLINHNNWTATTFTANSIDMFLRADGQQNGSATAPIMAANVNGYINILFNRYNSFETYLTMFTVQYVKTLS